MWKRLGYWAVAIPLSLAAASSFGEDNIDREAVRSYQELLGKYLQQEKVAEGWKWFAYRSHGFEATPMILIKLLPELDSEIWGLPSEKFSRFGHYVLPGDEKRPLPTSLGMSSFPTKKNPNPVIVTTETCATCHMGRVRLSNNEILTIYGGVNSKFDIRRWRTALEKTVAKYLGSRRDLRDTADKLREIVRSKPDGYFHENVEEDHRQREYFLRRDGAESMLKDFIAWTRTFTKAKERQRATAYKRNGNNIPPNVDEGYPGKLDASGDLLAQRLPLHYGMPEKASLTDIPSVWLQSEYTSGQWDGSVGEPLVRTDHIASSQVIRNLAAQVAVVPGTSVDRRVAFYALDFVSELPPPKFPFLSSYQGNQRENLVAKGAELFKNNCAECHRPKNDTYYPEVKTDLSRATVMTTLGSLLIGKIFSDACKTKLPDGTSPPSCGDFMQFFRSNQSVGPSYPAKPLTGIWARAPYLHNGSVATLKQLLLPATRRQRFVIGSLDYDSNEVGFAWDPEKLAEYRAKDPYAEIFDTSEDSLSNQGHDQEALTLNGKTYRLDWSNSESDAEALLEYLKTI